VSGGEAVHPPGGVVPDLVRGVVDDHEHRAAALVACPRLGRVGRPERVGDVDSADLSGVTDTPTFFINGRRHYGAYDINTLSAGVRAAGARAMLAQT